MGRVCPTAAADEPGRAAERTILPVGPDFATYFKKTSHAVQRCKNEQQRRSRGRETGRAPAGDALAAASRPPELVDARASTHFHALCELLCTAAGGKDLPPHAVRGALAALAEADAKSRLFDFPAFASRWRAALCDALLGCLLDRRHALLADEMAATLYALAKPDLHGFFGSFLPAKLAAAEGLDDAQRRALLDAWTPAADAPTFSARVRDAVSDVAHYRLLNTHAME